jgi:hypothetical protein
VQRRADEVGFFGWLEANGLVGSPGASKAVAMPKWDAKMLEARVSSKFKEDRAQAMQTIERLLSQTSLSRDEMNVSVSRAVDAYFNLTIALTSEVQPLDAHRLMTPYFIRLSSLMKKPQIEHERNSSAPTLYFEVQNSNFRQIQAARAKLGLEEN